MRLTSIRFCYTGATKRHYPTENHSSEVFFFFSLTDGQRAKTVENREIDLMPLERIASTFTVSLNVNFSPKELVDKYKCGWQTRKSLSWPTCKDFLLLWEKGLLKGLCMSVRCDKQDCNNGLLPIINNRAWCVERIDTKNGDPIISMARKWLHLCSHTQTGANSLQAAVAQEVEQVV